MASSYDKTPIPIFQCIQLDQLRQFPYTPISLYANLPNRNCERTCDCNIYRNHNPYPYPYP